MRLAYNGVRIIQLYGFRYEETSVEGVQILQRRRRVRQDGCLRHFWIVREEDGFDTTQHVVFDVIRLQGPLTERDCRDVIPAQMKIKLQTIYT